MKLEHLNEIKGIVILALSLILLASLVSFSPMDLGWFTSQPNVHTQNWIGIAGAYSAGILFFLVGLSSYFLVGIGVFFSWNKFTSRDLPFNFFKFLSILVLFTVAAGLFSFFAGDRGGARFTSGGIVGVVFSDFLVGYFQPLGALIILLTLGALALVVTGEFLVSPFFIWLGKGIFQALQRIVKGVPIPALPAASRAVPKVKQTEDEVKTEKFRSTVLHKVTEPKSVPVQAVKPASAPAAAVKPNIHIVAAPKTEAVPDAAKAVKTIGEYHLPSVDLLKDAPIVSDDKIQERLMSGAKILEETLADFGVNVKVVDIERGPVITRYELQPAPGVKIQSIASLTDDLALALSASAVRILAPIPGKNRVGIEVPNGASAAVFLKDVLAQKHLSKSDSKLNLSIGKDTSGKAIITDLAEMPHLLVAGTTGSGKTVCLNSLIISILFNASPSEVKFIMIDPKMVELVPYNDLPHLLCPVITDAKKATPALNWVVMEMESRYKQFNKEGVRNITGYHAKGLLMPYIVVVVDELADLMQVSAKTVEGAIARLAQLARAAGIHLILATQRPSVDVITGVIKANFSSRISFKVASKVDSRTVLDTNGAETLLGKGDFLFMKTGDSKPTRGQCCYVSDEEIGRVIDFIKKQGTPEYNESVLKAPVTAGGGNMDEKDEMYDEAVRVVVETNQASVTILQRRLRLGYSRAARLIDMMEQNGLVGPYAGSKARDILVDREKWLVENMGEAKIVPPMDSNNDKPSILKTTREAKGLTLEIVHEATKIPMDALRAIEEGYSSRILSPFYYRGFIKIYAEFLGLDVNEMYKEYGLDQPAKPASVATVSAAAKSKASREPAGPNVFLESLQEGFAFIFKPKTLKLILKIIGFLVVLFLLFKMSGCIASHWHKKTDRKVKIYNNAAPVQNAPVSPSTRHEIVQAPSQTDKVEIAVRAMRSTWIQVKSDGHVVFQMTLSKGSMESWSADNSIELSGRDIEQLDMEVNGRHIGTLGGGERRIRKVLITQEGLTVKK